jgi:hypothetical protein
MSAAPQLVSSNSPTPNFFRRFLKSLQDARMESAWETIYQHRDLLPPNYFKR